MMDRDRDLHEMADEGRALMSDYIKREDALNAFSNAFYSGLAAKINEIPSEDVEPVVRCKDCKFGNWYKGGDGRPYNYCTELERGGFEEADYCSFAERKDDE